MMQADTPRPQKIAIAGAGLMGQLLAWRLLLQGHSVTLYEAGRFDRPLSAAHTAAAMISPMSEVVVSDKSIYDKGMLSLQLWPEWIAELNAAHDPPVQYSAPGSLVVAHPQDEPELEQFYRDLDFHLGPSNNAQWLDRRQIQTLEPDLAHFERALLLPREAWLDNRQLLKNLLPQICHLGGQCFQENPVLFDPTASLDGAPLEGFDAVIDCRGIGARENCRHLRGVRGEVLWVETTEVQLRHPVRLVHPRYKLYVVPKPGNRFIIGATELESEDSSPVSVQSMLELCSALYTLNPAFSEARIVELDANLRPSFMNNLPLIEDDPVLDERGNWHRIIRVNGLYRHGYLLAPFLVQQIIACLATPTLFTDS